MLRLRQRAASQPEAQRTTQAPAAAALTASAVHGQTITVVRRKARGPGLGCLRLQGHRS